MNDLLQAVKSWEPPPGVIVAWSKGADSLAVRFHLDADGSQFGSLNLPPNTCVGCVPGILDVVCGQLMDRAGVAPKTPLDLALDAAHAEFAAGIGHIPPWRGGCSTPV